MGNVVIPGPSVLYVQWSCRRCGHRGGIAKTTIPVTPGWNTEMMQNLLVALRQKLVKTHMKQGCIAVYDDFDVSSYVPQGQTLLDKV